MRCLLPVAFFVGWLSSGLDAQSTNASLMGRISDPSKAVVADARVAAVGADTNVRHETTTSGSGEYFLPNLPPGRYRIEIDKPGFRTLVKPDVVLHVQDAVQLDFEMRLGPVTETLTVEAGARLVNTESGTVGTVVDRTFVENLPLNGRSFQSLITMTPGVVLTPASSSSPGQFSVNGQRSDANYFMVDGVSANVGVQPTAGLGPAGAGAAPGLSTQGGTNSLVSVDALQEFKIQSSTYAPEFGRSPGGQISIVTRSGTNKAHGSLFEYFRDAALDSADYFVKRQGLSKPKEHQHDFGGVFGGPLERDRTFIFVSYEGLRLDQPRTAVTEVPSLASRLAASDAVNPILAAFPLPNGPDTANGLAKFSASYTDPSTLDATSVRVDRTFGNSVTVFGRYNYSPSDGSSRLGSFAIASANTIGWVKQQLQTLTAGTTWIIGPTLSNELRANWSRNVGENFQVLDAFGGAVVPSSAMLHPAFAPAQSTYRVNLGPANVFFDEGPNASNIQRQVNIVDALQLTKTRHHVKLGIDYRRLLPIYGPTAYVQAYTFNGVAGVLGGAATSVLTASGSTRNRSSHGTNFSAYAQDTWSPASALTITYGVRWDVNPAPGLNDSNEALTLTTADPATMAFAAPGTPMYKTTYGNVAPRLGAAHRLRDAPGRELVLRGGWGLFFDLASPAVLNNLSQTFPFTARANLTNVPFPTDPSLLAPPTVAPGAPADFLVAADPDLKLPYTHQWNLAVEQALGDTSTVSVSYVGAAGRRLLTQERVLNPSPQIQFVTLGTNRGHSRYDSLQVKYARRLSSGLQALASYTLARSRDNISTDAVAVLPLFRADPDQDWGPSDFDVRHTLSGGVTYAIPAGGVAPAWRWLASGWSVDGVLVARSALPVNVVTGRAVFSTSNALRPDLVPGMPLYVDDDAVPGGRRFNPAAFTPPPLDASGNPPRQGTLGRNALRGFPMNQVDLAVHRDIPLRGDVHLELRAEAFNLFDRASFGPPTNTLTSGLFGQSTRTLASSFGAGGITGGGLSPLYQVGGPRSVQLAARLQF
jgi:Carboxypeptidase regulatory-like domain/TonB dependent receptor-like, beta-barrel